MKAVVVQRGESRPEIAEIDEPTPQPGEVLLRTLRVGIDGTDHEVVRGNHGGFPEGDNYQILGHESVAVVEDANGTDLQEGQLVVPTVRRPRENTNEYFERGEPDMAPDGTYVERGIVGAHGYMAEYVTSPPEYLVPVPDAFAQHGFLIEPISNTEKAIEHAFAARSAFEWNPESALVLGNGPLGLLTLAMLEAPRSSFEKTYCLGRRDRPDPTIDIIEQLGSTYVDSRDTPVSQIPDRYEPVDFVYEATGYAKHAFETITALKPNGIGALLGIPDDWAFEVDGGRLHRELVLHNKALFGSVNSNIRHYEAAKESLDAVPDWFIEELITDVHRPNEVEDAFNTTDKTIKTVVEFDSF
jgi:threonine dehydrogenase-like Zn-dependent dehydrogenase